MRAFVLIMGMVVLVSCGSADSSLFGTSWLVDDIELMGAAADDPSAVLAKEQTLDLIKSVDMVFNLEQDQLNWKMTAPTGVRCVASISAKTEAKENTILYEVSRETSLEINCPGEAVQKMPASKQMTFRFEKVGSNEMRLSGNQSEILNLGGQVMSGYFILVPAPSHLAKAASRTRRHVASDVVVETILDDLVKGLPPKKE